ncbi:MAG TPA: hypothetical protein VIR56_05510 [Solimonas sp.]
MLGRLGKSMKEGALSVALRAYVNDRFSEYGEVLDCQIDTKENRLTFRVMLRGEKEPASGSIDRYQIEREGDDVYLKMRSFSTSREWITLLLNQLLAGKRFKIPSKVAGLL